MDCGKVRELITEHIDGLLAQGQRDALEVHMASCEGCSRLYKGHAQAHAMAKSAHRFAAPGGFAASVMEEIRTLDEETGFWDWLWSMPSYIKLAQAAAAAVIVFTGVYSAELLSGRLMSGDEGPDNGEASVVASVGAEYLDALPPESMGEMYLSTEENGNEKQVP